MKRIWHQKKMSYIFGYLAELLAIGMLYFRGYRCIAHRYKSYYGEIDLIMQHGDTVVFIEVKGRRNIAIDFDVSTLLKYRQKMRIKRSASHFLARNNLTCKIRFDLIIISLWRGVVHFQCAW